MAVYGLARFVMAIPAGQLSDWLGRRSTLAIGGLVSALGNLWCGYATGYPEFIVARFVAGAGAGLILTTGQVVLADISTPERRGRTIAIYQGTFLFAVGFGPFPGWCAGRAFQPGCAVHRLRCRQCARHCGGVVRHQRNTRSVARPPACRRRRPAGLRDAVAPAPAKPGFLLVSLISLMNAVVRTGGLFAIIPMLANVRLGLTAGPIGFALMLGGVCGLLAAYPGGWLADRFGRKAVIVPATIMTGLSMLLFCVAPTYAWFVAACIVWGVASSVGGAAPAAYAADSAPQGMNAAAMSTFRMTGDAGYVIGPLALGLIADLTDRSRPC